MKRIGVNFKIQVLSASNSVAYEHWINEPFHRTYNVPEQYGLAREYIHGDSQLYIKATRIEAHVFPGV